MGVGAAGFAGAGGFAETAGFAEEAGFGEEAADCAADDGGTEEKMEEAEDGSDETALSLCKKEEIWEAVLEGVEPGGAELGPTCVCEVQE